MSRMFKKKEIYKVNSVLVNPAKMGEPASADEYLRRGMAYYARRQFNQAEEDLRKAISMDSDQIDAYYCLGMVLKALDCKEDASAAFNKVINLIENNIKLKNTRSDMLRKLALGHINEMNLGDWNLEKEIWKHIV